MRYHPKTKPFPHQSRAVLRAVRQRNYAFFFEPRCGKSKAALDYCGIMALKQDSPSPLKVLIIAPRIALGVWDGQIKRHYPFESRLETFDEEWGYPGDYGLHTPTYFFLAGREETFRRTRGTKKSGKNFYRRTKQQELEAWNPDVIILDESHEYKRPGGVAAQDAWRLVRRLRKKRRANGLPYVLLLSGTPEAHGWIDLFAQLRIMDESLLGTSVADFREDHVIYGHGKRRWTIIKYRREKKLERILRNHSYTVTAEQAGLANKQFYQRLDVALPDDVKALYLELAEEFIAEWKGGVISAKNAGVKRIRLLQLVGGFAGGRQVHAEKLRALRSYSALLLEQRESVVVYCRFTPEVEFSTAEMESVGFRTFRVDGSTSTKDRGRAIRSLERRPKTPTAVVFQYQSGSRAIELVGAAETVYYSCPDGWIDYFQTSRRTQGPNQKRAVRYTFLTCPGTVDVGVIRGLKRKEEWHDTMMRDPRGYLLGV